MTKILLAKIYVDLDKVKLPDYEYTYDCMIEEMGFKEATDYIMKKHKVKLDYLADNYSAEFSETPSRKTNAKFKRLLLEKLKDDMKTLLELYEGGDMDEPSLSSAIDFAGEPIYTEPYDDLSWKIDVPIEVKI